MEIIDNVLSEEDYERLWTTMISDDFAWFFAVTKVRHYVGDNLQINYLMTIQIIVNFVIIFMHRILSLVNIGT